MKAIIILISVIVAIDIATITNSINLSFAQSNSTSSSATGKSNITGPPITAPSKHISIGPSNFTASPITNEVQGNATPANTSIPSSRGTFLGTR